MAAAGFSALRAALGHSKFTSDSLGVLLIDSGYHLQAECRSALAALGHRVHSVPIRAQAGDDAAAVLQRILVAAVQVRPDFVLTVNHLGFDAQGALAQALEQVEMPVAVWYVDSPLFVLRQWRALAPQVTSVFVWERSYVPLLQRMGMQDVHWLPLGADTASMAGPQTPPLPGRVAFVGSSWQGQAQMWQARVAPQVRAQAAKLTAALLQSRAALLPALAEHGAQPGAADWLAAATFAASCAQRTALLEAAPPLDVWGDEGWRAALPEAAHHGPIDYGPALSQVYRSATVNLNVTSLQMPTAVNQRVFDLPAAGGFLLTDAQEDVASFFEPGVEVSLYHDADELRERAHWYLTHPQACAAQVLRAHARVLREHTYVHRLQSLIHHLRARHARRGVPVHGGVPC